MAVKTIYICDVCQREVRANEIRKITVTDFWKEVLECYDLCPECWLDLFKSLVYEKRKKEAV